MSLEATGYELTRKLVELIRRRNKLGSIPWSSIHDGTLYLLARHLLYYTQYLLNSQSFALQDTYIVSVQVTDVTDDGASHTLQKEKSTASVRR